MFLWISEYAPQNTYMHTTNTRPTLPLIFFHPVLDQELLFRGVARAHLMYMKIAR